MPEHRRHRGFTLPETLTVVTITGLIIAALLALTMVSMRIWYRVSSQQQAFPTANLIMHRIDRELKNAYTVAITHDGTAITFRLPQQEVRIVDGHEESVNCLDAAGHLMFGSEISYYRADESGDIDNPGTILWRAETRPSADPVLRRIADNVIDMVFTADTASNRVYEVYSTTITVLGATGAQQYRSQFDGAVAFRNETTIE